MTVLVNKMNVFRTNIHFGLCTTSPDHVSDKTLRTLGAKSNKRCDRLNIFKTITVQKNPIVLTGCKRFSDITFLSNQISTFGMVIVCTGTDHRRRSVEIYVGLSFQCSLTKRCVLPSWNRERNSFGTETNFTTVIITIYKFFEGNKLTSNPSEPEKNREDEAKV